METKKWTYKYHKAEGDVSKYIIFTTTHAFDPYDNYYEGEKIIHIAECKTEDHAKIIVSAPDVLEALKGFIHALSHLEKNNIPNKLWEMGINAVKKAT